jgi:uncharacterized protein YndB with AHSA1/START domain
MATVELERTLVKSPPELWEELAAPEGLRRWFGEIRVRVAEPPHRLEWDSDVAEGVIELEASGWGTKVRALAEAGEPGVEERLAHLLDDLGSSSLTGA